MKTFISCLILVGAALTVAGYAVENADPARFGQLFFMAAVCLIGAGLLSRRIRVANRLTLGIRSEPCGERERLREALEALNAHVEAMQQMTMRYLIPDSYTDRDGVVWSDGDPEPLACDLISMLDGPEQREVQAKARAALSHLAQTQSEG
jgi:hypothetical protein